MTYYPIVKNYMSAPSNPIENQCYYNGTDDTYYVYANNQWNAVSGIITNSFILQYTTTSNSSWTVEQYSTLADIKDRIKNFTDTLKEVNIYFGTLANPVDSYYIGATFYGDYENPPMIYTWEAKDSFYIWKPLARIFPKIVYNNQIVNHVNYPSIGNSETVYYTNNLVHTLYPDFSLEITEKSSPADINVGYTIGEVIQLEFKYTYYGTLQQLNNVHIYSDNLLNITFNIANGVSQNSYIRNYTVTEADCLDLSHVKDFSCFLTYAASTDYPSLNDYETSVLLSINNIANAHRGFKITYETTDGTTGELLYNSWDDLTTYIHTGASLKFKKCFIDEGVFYDSL